MDAKELKELGRQVSLGFAIPEFALGLYMMTWVYQFFLYRNTFVMKKRHSKSSLISSTCFSLSVHCCALMTLWIHNYINIGNRETVGFIILLIYGLFMQIGAFIYLYRVWMVS